MKNNRTGKQVLISLMIVAACVALASITGTRRVSAATFTVTNTDDSGMGSLRQAIIDANGNMEADTIDFAAGVTGTITLLSALPQITENLTINGPGAGVLTVSGANLYQVINIAPGVTASISGLTISHGNSVFGGGILNGGMLTFINSTLSGNSAPLGEGGGISNGGTLTVTNSTLSDNSAANGIGGGIFNTGTLTVTNSILSGNSSPNGGGIFNFTGATLTVTNSTLSGNSAPSEGGGIFNGGTLTITNSTLSGNSASLGCGIFNQVTLTITNSTLSGNSAPTGAGGGIFNNGTLTITNSTFSGNSVVIGGGIFNQGTLRVTNSTLSGNSGATAGGGIFNIGTATVANSTLSGNSGAQAGGGIFNVGPATVKNSIIANSPSGGNCGGTPINAVGVNFSTDSTCPGFMQVTTAQLNLGPLQDNGGPTETHALLAGSVAIDAVMDCTDLSATPAPVNTDQRGVMRPIDGDGDGTALCDVGAFEAAACISDTQPPTITCPANVTAVAAQTCPLSSSATVTFPAPTASDNCPGVTVACTPPSDSTFPLGTTTVTCTATDASTNTATCSFTVTVFSGCLQDDSNPTNVVLFNAATGEYRFCCGGTVLSGVGTLLVKGCTVTIQHYPADRRVLIKFDGGTSTGTASLQSPPGVLKCTITDRNTKNNTCTCQFSARADSIF